MVTHLEGTVIVASESECALLALSSLQGLQISRIEYTVVRDDALSCFSIDATFRPNHNPIVHEKEVDSIMYANWLSSY